jgi:hypothetical protein
VGNGNPTWGGKRNFVAGLFGHTSFVLVPPGDNRTQPEWFSTHYKPAPVGQLCWSAPGLLEFLIARVSSVLREANISKADPGSHLISVSQMDNEDFCTAPAELAIAAGEGSQAAPILVRSPKLAVAFSQSSYILMTYRVVGTSLMVPL